MNDRGESGNFPTEGAAGSGSAKRPRGRGKKSTPPEPVASSLLNRELCWLDFNRRVLELSQDPAVPLLERVKFLAIFASNLDEFFMKRVGGLQRQREAHVTERSPDGMTAQEQLDAIHDRVRPMLRDQVQCWFEDIHPALKREGIAIRRYQKLDTAQQRFADEFFDRQLFPILTPLAVDHGHPFPFISNLSKSMGVMVEHPVTGDHSFCRLKIPENLSRWVPLPADGAENLKRQEFVPIEHIIGANLTKLFPGMTVLEHHLFRVTRNADIELDEEDAEDLLEMVELELRRRRLARVVRLELPEGMNPSMRQMIIDGLEVDPEDVYTLPGPMDMDDLFGIAEVDRPDLKYKAWKPIVPPRLADDEDVDIFTVIRGGDMLVHHPYEDFAASVEKFIIDAAMDPKVLAIKMTLYRTSRDSPFVTALIRAAEMGKQVAVLVELKARFDEQRNVEIAQQLEKAGVHVVYGMIGLKTHTKLAMVVREEATGPRAYAHIGTGNYNSRTALLYTDLGLFTCNDAITREVIELFHYLTGRSTKSDYKELLVAPVNMRRRFLEMIAREIEHAKAGRGGRITAKMNALQDAETIDALYAASAAGVSIDLLVRGFCCLRPGVPGLSENIRVICILGRFLEHSRIYRFENNGAPEFYIGSADWMYRNLDYRVEAITPVHEPTLQAVMDHLLVTMLNDTNHAWLMHGDGSWHRRSGKNGSHGDDTQELLMQRTLDSRR